MFIKNESFHPITPPPKIVLVSITWYNSHDINQFIIIEINFQGKGGDAYFEFHVQ